MKLESRLRKIEDSIPEPKKNPISESPEVIKEFLNNCAEFVQNNNFPGIVCNWFLLSNNEIDEIALSYSKNNYEKTSRKQRDVLIELLDSYSRFVDYKNFYSCIQELSKPSTLDDPYSIKVEFYRNGENKTIIANRGDIIVSWFDDYYTNNHIEPHPKVIECFERYCGSWRAPL